MSTQSGHVKPDAKNYNPSPDYLRSLVDSSGLSQRECARRLGINERTMRHWLSGHTDIPYAAQYCLEVLSGQQECNQRD